MKYHAPAGIQRLNIRAKHLRFGQWGVGSLVENGQKSAGEITIGPERVRDVRLGDWLRLCRVELRWSVVGALECRAVIGVKLWFLGAEWWYSRLKLSNDSEARADRA